ncbi:flagellar export protein FliJ [Noviherbaspirillum pedocola]|uniref:Flagellar FliJ protein n=1 Tax=Noviherbaspirillum pedocola TaxID=2801341 RepID=A0A934W910_9BURK|nr:flagellar export protein FliJ [Noviherbaspirillum pedocola]MBK4739302.1 flagellar export protein FliJ [Noviherbaspirillum pedocola]
MANLFALQTLIELAVTEVDEAAQRLGRAVKNVDGARQKLELLSNYREEYVSRFQQTMTNGFTPMAYRNYQNFMDKLDTAIHGQEQLVRDAEKRAEGERSAWRESERKRISYDALKTRAETAIEKKEAKREQKQSDEAAARKFLYKR